MGIEERALKQQIVAVLDILPVDALKETQRFLDTLRFKLTKSTKPPYTPAKLGGLLQGYQFSEEDVAKARREMWGSLGELTGE